MNRKRKYLICYDIANPKRLQKVHRVVCRYAIMIQYSVYLAELNQTQHDALLITLAHIIDKKKDDIRLYPIPSHPKSIQLGLPCLSDTIWLGGVSDFLG